MPTFLELPTFRFVEYLVMCSPITCKLRSQMVFAGFRKVYTDSKLNMWVYRLMGVHFYKMCNFQQVITWGFWNFFWKLSFYQTCLFQTKHDISKSYGQGSPKIQLRSWFYDIPRALLCLWSYWTCIKVFRTFL